MAEMKTYRHRKTGIVERYSPAFAKNFPDLVEVEPGAKPLAYTPIPEARVQALADKADESASKAVMKPAEPTPKRADEAEEI